MMADILYTIFIAFIGFVVGVGIATDNIQFDRTDIQYALDICESNGGLKYLEGESIVVCENGGTFEIIRGVKHD